MIVRLDGFVNMRIGRMYVVGFWPSAAWYVASFGWSFFRPAGEKRTNREMMMY